MGEELNMSITNQGLLKGGIQEKGEGMPEFFTVLNT